MDWWLVFLFFSMLPGSDSERTCSNVSLSLYRRSGEAAKPPDIKHSLLLGPHNQLSLSNSPRNQNTTYQTRCSAPICASAIHPAQIDWISTHQNSACYCFPGRFSQLLPTKDSHGVFDELDPADSMAEQDSRSIVCRLKCENMLCQGCFMKVDFITALANCEYLWMVIWPSRHWGYWDMFIFSRN